MYNHADTDDFTYGVETVIIKYRSLRYVRNKNLRGKSIFA